MKQHSQIWADRLITRRAVLFGWVLACLLTSAAVFAQINPSRAVEGKVYAESQPLSSAVVYLQDTKTNNIKSFISTSDGSYRFGQLSGDVDYQIWAEYKGKKSDKKTVSSFNTKKQLTIDLHIKN